MHRTQLSTLAWLAFTTLTHLGTATPTPDVASYAIVERSGSQDSSYNSGSSSGGDSGAGTSSYGGSSYSSGSSSGGNTGAGDSSYGGGSSPYNPDSSNKGNSGYGMPNYGDSGNSKSTAVSHDHTTKNYGNSYDTTSSYEYNHDTTTSYEHNYYTTESYNQYDTTTTYNGVYYTTTTTSTAAYSNMTPPPYYNASNVTVTYDAETTLTNFVTETSEVDETMTVFETMTVTSDLSYTTVVYESVQTLVTISQFSLQSTEIMSIEIETTSQRASTIVTEQLFTTQTVLGTAPSASMFSYTASTGLQSTTTALLPFTGAGVPQLNAKGGVAMSVAALVGVLAWLL